MHKNSVFLKSSFFCIYIYNFRDFYCDLHAHDAKICAFLCKIVCCHTLKILIDYNIHCYAEKEHCETGYVWLVCVMV